LTWRLADGQTRSVPVAGEAVSCTSGTTLIDGDGARVFEVFPRRKTDRGFQADVLAACDAASATPRELAVADVHDQLSWEPRALERTGSRVAFLAGYRGIGLLDGGTVRFAELVGLGGLDDVAVGAAGDVVFAGLSGDGGFSQRLVARWTASGWERLAAQGGDLVDGSLAVGDDGRVTWQTKDGFAHGVPLAGDTTIDCHVGTTLLDRDGWRVFEVMPAGGDDVRLYGCAPGAAPVQLGTAKRTGSWKAVELARENDRLAFYAVAASTGTADAVVSFGAGSVQSGTPATFFGRIRDTAIAPDGRVALASYDGRRWRITAFAGGRERILAKRTDGVRVGSLTFDGTRVSWLNRAGVTRSATAP
jgi:hypothetical protein